jgi:predicted nucleic acid-binding Zn ribbon protein
MKRKRTQPISLADVLGGASRRIGFGEKLKHMKLMARWEKIAGSAVARHARPSRLRGRTLIVRVDQPTWMQELTFLKHEIMERIREEFKEGAPSDMKLELGELPPWSSTKEEPERAEMRELDDDEKEFIQVAADEIDDPDIRDAARRAMSAGFGRSGTKKS